MGLVALAILVVVAVGIGVGVHTGPHGLLASGVVGILASVAFVVIAVEAVSASSRTSIAWALLGATAFVSVTALVAGAVALPALRRRQADVGANRLLGAPGVVVKDLDPVGTVRVRGETWTAESLSGPLREGTAVEVVEIEGLHLKVWSDATLTAEGDARQLAPKEDRA